jgi:signal transduction histidine kinase
MDEIEAIKLHLERYHAILSQQIDRVCNALEELQRSTLHLLDLNADSDEEAIDAWLQKEGFAVDAEGFFQSQPLLSAFRKGTAPKDAISFSWGQHLQSDSTARRHLYSHRALGPRLKHLYDRLEGAVWIYYQDAGNTALQYPYIDQRTAIPSDFDWTTYHTYLSVCPENNPQRRIQWTPPSIDYAGKGLIVSASLPVWRDDVFIGLWSVDLPVQSLYRDFPDAKALPDQEQFIVDRKGMLVLHEQLEGNVDHCKGEIFRHLLKALGGQWAHLDLEFLVAEERNPLFIKDVADMEWCFCYRYIPGVEWILFCGLPTSSMEEAAAWRLEKALRQIADGNFSYRIESSSTKLFSTLVDAFNMMSLRLSEMKKQRQEMESTLRQAQKMEAFGKLTASIAHEFGNPLLGIWFTLRDMQERCELASADRKLLELATNECDRMRKLIRALRQINRQSTGKRIDFDLHQVLDEILVLHQNLLAEKAIVVAKNYDRRTIRLFAMEDQMRQVFINLILNAVDAMAVLSGGILTIGTALEKKACVITIGDNGSGIPAKNLSQIFEPFFTTKGMVEGSGLGLAVSYGIVRSHGGTLNVRSVPGNTVFRIRLPIEAPAVASQPESWSGID